jgi:hypothetical protein
MSFLCGLHSRNQSNYKIKRNGFKVYFNYRTKQVAEGSNEIIVHHYIKVPIKQIDKSFYVEIPEGSDYYMTIVNNRDGLCRLEQNIEGAMIENVEIKSSWRSENPIHTCWRTFIGRIHTPGSTDNTRGLILLRFYPYKKNRWHRISDTKNNTLIALRMISIPSDSILIPNNSTPIPPPI